MDEFYI